MIFLFIIQYLKIVPYVHRFELKFYLKRWQRLWKEFSSVTGLPNPGEDQSDEDLVESVLKLANIPEASVRRAVRLPMRTRDLKSLVLVELDTKSHQKEVLDNRSLIRSSPALSVLFKLVKTIVALLASSSKWDFNDLFLLSRSLYGKSFNNASLKIGIRRARYKELWKYIQDLLTVKYVNTEILAGITSGLSSADNNQTSQTTLETTLSTTSAEENAISDVSEETDTTTQVQKEAFERNLISHYHQGGISKC